jgi:hypothetical protein
MGFNQTFQYTSPMFTRRPVLVAWLACLFFGFQTLAQLEVATFDSDANPSTGSSLAYDPMIGSGELSLRCRGIVIRGSGDPIVLCSIDWLGVANESHDQFRDLLAAAAGTSRDRVALHAVHQHDAPVADLTAHRVLASRDIAPGPFDAAITAPAMTRAARAVQSLTNRFRPWTHVGWGRGEVQQVASNRRIPNTNGTVRAVRYTSSKDPDLRAAPEGVIDPFVISLSFWDNDAPLAVLTYYATHPQSYYRTGIANPDFPGIARFLRDQALPGTLHVHFNGAGGNIGAGKYNDGSPTNRAVLAQRLADGMARSWRDTVRKPVRQSDLKWRSIPVLLPAAPHLDAAKLDAAIRRPSPALHLQASQFAFLQRVQASAPIDISCLTIGDIRVLHLPGELFVEYQLAAQAMRPDLQVAMASYGDYGTAYIGTEAAYSQGGYETEPSSSSVAPQSQGILFRALHQLLETPPFAR